MPAPVTYDRPVGAKLVVRLDNGDEWDATDEDLKRFDLARPLDLYNRFHELFVEALGIDRFKDLDEGCAAHAVRYLVECALTAPWSPWAQEDGTPWPEEDQDAGEKIRDLIRRALGDPRPAIIAYLAKELPDMEPRAGIAADIALAVGFGVDG